MEGRDVNQTVNTLDIACHRYNNIWRVTPSGQERPMTDNELKAQAEKLKQLTHKIQAYLESARRSVMSQFPRIDRSVVEIKWSGR